MLQIDEQTTSKGNERRTKSLRRLMLKNSLGRLLGKTDIWKVASHSRTGRVYACSGDVLVGG